jgi:hypothetical protein
MKNPFKRKKAQQEVPEQSTTEENISGEISRENISGDDSAPDESLPKTKKELKAEKKKQKKAKALEKKKAKNASKAEKAKLKAKGANVPKAPKEKKPKKPKLTKEEKKELKAAKQAAKTAKAQAQAKQKAAKAREKLTKKTEKARARVAKKVEKIRARATVKNEKIQLKKEQRLEKKQAEKDHKAEMKQFKRELRAEIKAAKKDLPKNKLLMVLAPVLIVVLLVGSTFFLGNRGIGPLASVSLPNPVPLVKSVLPEEAPGFIKAITSIQLPSFSLGSVLPGSDSKVEETVNELFVCLVELDFQGAEEYIETQQVAIPEVIPGGYLAFIDQAALMDATFDKLVCEIILTEKVAESEYEEYHVTANITAVDVKPFISSFVREALQLEYGNATAQPPLSQAELDRKIEAMFFEKAEDPNLATIVTETVITVRKIEGNWKVIADSVFMDAIFGGIITVGGQYFD